ncbi:hypothetical protein BDR03DRAFT_1003502 [Suillus americanus]|nr:hypothetical protein BDR03DRAFT_1003502 [Suillus americanus]
MIFFNRIHIYPYFLEAYRPVCKGNKSLVHGSMRAVEFKSLGLIRILGPDLSLAGFCAACELSPEIQGKLADMNGYTGAQTIRYTVVSKLKEMSFNDGEIVAMKDAVAQWTTTIDTSSRQPKLGVFGR